MDRSSGAGQVNPAAVDITVKSVITNRQIELNDACATRAALRSIPSGSAEYSVADLFGRCFLRVCYWVDVFASITRRGEPLPYLPIAHQPVRSLEAVQPSEVLKAESMGQAIAPPVANA